jgi:hypothetical protein
VGTDGPFTPGTTQSGVINGLVLSCPTYSHWFYLKTNYSKHGMAAVLCQADPDCPELVAAEKSEVTCGPCLFDKAKSWPHLISILFMAHLTTCTKTKPQQVGGRSTRTTSSRCGKHLHGSPSAADCNSNSLKSASIMTGISTSGKQSYSNTASLSGTTIPNGPSDAISCHGTTWATISNRRGTILSNVPKLPQWRHEPDIGEPFSSGLKTANQSPSGLP